MSLHKDVKELGMPWEEKYGYAQAVKVDDTIYVSGQFSHDDQGNMVGPALLDGTGRIVDHSNMETQMLQRMRMQRRSSMISARPWTTSSRRFFTSQTWRKHSPWRAQFGKRQRGNISLTNLQALNAILF